MHQELNGPHVLFALQLMFPLDEVEDLVPEVGNLVLEASDRMSVAGKSAFLDAVSSALLSQLENLRYVCWDVVTDPEDAETEYWSWIEGTAADARAEAPWEREDEAQFGFVTILLMARHDSVTAERILALDEVDEGDRTSAEHVAHMLSTLGVLDLAGLTSDVVMVRPGDGGHGVTEGLLAGETYHHLQPILA